MEEPIADCPACGTEPHDLLRSSEAGHTVKCRSCGHVHRVPAQRERQAIMALVLSEGPRSWTERMPAPADEPVRVGDEFELDGHRYLVTGIERTDGTAKDHALASEVRVLHAKQFDQVVLKISVNEGESTYSRELRVDPERPVRIGEVLAVDDTPVVVKTLKSDENRTVRKTGLLARHIVRVFCDPAPPGAEPGTNVPVRPSGREQRRKEEAEARKAARDKARKAAHAQGKPPERRKAPPKAPPSRAPSSRAAPPPGRRLPDSKGPVAPPGRRRR